MSACAHDFCKEGNAFGTTECFAEGVGQTHPEHREIGWSLYFFP